MGRELPLFAHSPPTPALSGGQQPSAPAGTQHGLPQNAEAKAGAGPPRRARERDPRRSCSPCPRAHPGLRLLPGSGGARGQEGRHAGAQPRHGLGGNARGRLGRRAGRLKVTAGRSGDARPALTIRAASGGWNGTAFAPPTPGPQAEDGAGTRRRERARIQSERYMVRQETGQDSKRWKPRLRARCQNPSSPLDCTLIQSTASY